MTSSDKLLLVDIGNSQIKWSLGSFASLGALRELPTRPDRIRSGFSGARRAVAAVVSSVVPGLNPLLRTRLNRLGIRRTHFISHRSDLGIGIRYPDPSRIGADRLANAVAAFRLAGAPVIVVDFGTAVTFDIVSSKAEYVGGIICPGIRLMTDYLHEKTALLPHVSIAEPRKKIGKSTREAIRIGAVVGFRGMISHLLQALEKEPGIRRSGRRRITVIATGGSSRLIASKIPGITRIEPRLTLEGLKIIAARIYGC